jgi:hypothetical protein
VQDWWIVPGFADSEECLSDRSASVASYAEYALNGNKETAMLDRAMALPITLALR